MLPPEVQRLEEQHDWHHGQRKQYQDDLDRSLPRVKLLFNRAWRKEHVDEHIQQAWWLLSDGIPVDRPLIDDGEDEVAEDGLEKDHAGEEVAKDVDWCAEVAGVDIGEAEGVGHLIMATVSTILVGS